MITSILAFVIAFGLLVIVHEFGHYWMAKKQGIFVETFSIGFGPKLFTFKRKETQFCISAIPLGGYVKMRGEEEGQDIPKDDKSAFVNQSVKARCGIVLAGPFMNIVLSFILMPLVFWIGKTEPAFMTEPPVVSRVLPISPAEKAGFQIGDKILKLDGKETPNWETVLEPLSLIKPGQKVSIEIKRGSLSKILEVETQGFPRGEGAYVGFEKFFGDPPQALVKQAIEGEPAAKAGIKANDKIVGVIDNRIPANQTDIHNWDELVSEVNRLNGAGFSMVVLRAGETLNFSVTPKWDAANQRWIIGIQGSDDVGAMPLSLRRYGFFGAIKVGFKTNVKNIFLTFEVIKKLVSQELSYKTLGGPVAIAYTLAKASASGIADFLYFTAFLSLQLGILNLLPIPVLDGGHLVFFLSEAIRGKPLALKTRMVATQVGMVLLLTLVAFVTWNDLKRFIGF